MYTGASSSTIQQSQLQSYPYMSFPMLLKPNKKGHNSDLTGENDHNYDLSFYNVWSILLFCLCMYDSDAQSMEANNTTNTTANNSNNNNNNIVITDDIQFGHGYTLAGKRACVYTCVIVVYICVYISCMYLRCLFVYYSIYSYV